MTQTPDQPPDDSSIPPLILLAWGHNEQVSK